MLQKTGDRQRHFKQANYNHTKIKPTVCNTKSSKLKTELQESLINWGYIRFYEKLIRFCSTYGINKSGFTLNMTIIFFASHHKFISSLSFVIFKCWNNHSCIHFPEMKKNLLIFAKI